MKRLLAGLLVALPLAAAAQPVVPPVPARTQAEIDHLFDYIVKSDCRFNRNGSWHDMVAARAHVNTKYEYLKERGKIDSAESFIDNAASKSSFSGQDYQVQCSGSEPAPSATWLKAELARFRQIQAIPASIPAQPVAKGQTQAKSQAQAQARN
jgi:hypothetical protein